MATKKQRQRRLARQAHQRRMDRRAQQDRRARQWGAGIIVAVLVIGVGVGTAAIGGVFSPAKAKPTAGAKTSPAVSATPSATPSPSSTPAMVDGKCVYIAAGKAARKVSLPPATPDTKATYVATIRTNRGRIVMDLLNSRAPCTVNSFVSLADQGFFNNTHCQRLTTAAAGYYILQCGDPTGTGSGGPGYEYGSENLTGAIYPAGTVAMANISGEPDSNGSQFFMVYQDSSFPPDYTPFGTIVSGLNIIRNIAKAGTDNSSGTGDGHPKEKVQIETVTIQKT